MRYRFSEVFQEDSSGMISPKRPVQIGGIMMTPGVSFGGSVSFGGIDLSQYRGKDLEGEVSGEVLIIKGFYN